jgi:hypothetical protein
MSETMRVKAVNSTMRVKALRTADGTVDVPAEGSVEADIVTLTQDQIEEFRLVHGVTITPVKSRKGRSEEPPKPDRAALENAAEAAKAALDIAVAGSDLDAQAAAQQAYDEACKALAALEA